MRRTMGVGLALILIVATSVVVTAPAMGFAVEHHYCDQYLEPKGTCPPNGNSIWAHLEINESEDPGESHETCIDEYLDPSGSGYYTTAKCVYYVWENPAKQFPGGTWGYPRTWNGGSVTHYIAATEYGY
jgi:hypothetical protein